MKFDSGLRRELLDAHAARVVAADAARRAEPDDALAVHEDGVDRVGAQAPGRPLEREALDDAPVLQAEDAARLGARVQLAARRGRERRHLARGDARDLRRPREVAALDLEDAAVGGGGLHAVVERARRVARQRLDVEGARPRGDLLRSPPGSNVISPRPCVPTTTVLPSYARPVNSNPCGLPGATVRRCSTWVTSSAPPSRRRHSKRSPSAVEMKARPGASATATARTDLSRVSSTRRNCCEPGGRTYAPLSAPTHSAPSGPAASARTRGPASPSARHRLHAAAVVAREPRVGAEPHLPLCVLRHRAHLIGREPVEERHRAPAVERRRRLVPFKGVGGGQ